MLRVFLADSRSPFEIGNERRSKLGVARKHGILRALAKHLHPMRALLLGNALANVLGDHAGVAAVLSRVEIRAAENFAEPCGDAFRMVGRHSRKQRTDERVLGHVFGIKNARHAQQRGKAACPLKERRLVLWRGHGIGELHIPVHPATERLILRMPAAAQAEMLPRRTFSSGHVVSIFVDKPDPARDPVRPILGDFDRCSSMLVDLVAGFHSLDAITEGSRRAGAHCLDDFVEPSAAGSNERLLPGVKDRGQMVGAKSRVGADAPVVEDLDLYAVVLVALVRDPLRVLRAGETRLGVAAVAERLVR